jgi:hypothetical protein
MLYDNHLHNHYIYINPRDKETIEKQTKTTKEKQYKNNQRTTNSKTIILNLDLT